MVHYQHKAKVTRKSKGISQKLKIHVLKLKSQTPRQFLPIVVMVKKSGLPDLHSESTLLVTKCRENFQIIIYVI